MLLRLIMLRILRPIIILLSLSALCCNHASADSSPDSLIAINADTQQIYLLQRKDTTPAHYQLWREEIHTRQRTRLFDISVDAENTIHAASAMLWEPNQQTLLISDSSSNRVVNIAPHSAKTNLLSGSNRGAGPALGIISDLALDSIQQRVIVLDQVKQGHQVLRLLTSIDLHSGDRQILSGASVGSGPLLASNAMTYDHVEHIVYLAYDTGILRVDLQTGNREIISDSSRNIGFGPALLHINTIEHDYLGHRLLIKDAMLRQIIAVDKSSGDRQLLHDWHQSTKIGMRWGQSSVLHNDLLYLGDNKHQMVIAFDTISSTIYPQRLITPKSPDLPAIHSRKMQITPQQSQPLFQQCTITPEVVTAQEFFARVLKHTNDQLEWYSPVYRPLLRPFFYINTLFYTAFQDTLDPCKIVPSWVLLLNFVALIVFGTALAISGTLLSAVTTVLTPIVSILVISLSAAGYFANVLISVLRTALGI